METKILALIVSFIGLFVIFVISLFIEPLPVAISEIESIELGDVRITGQVISVSNYDNLAIVKVAEVKSVDVVVFDKRLIDFSEGSNITVYGEIRDYKGKKEIIAYDVRLRSSIS